MRKEKGVEMADLCLRGEKYLIEVNKYKTTLVWEIRFKSTLMREKTPLSST